MSSLNFQVGTLSIRMNYNMDEQEDFQDFAIQNSINENEVNMYFDNLPQNSHFATQNINNLEVLNNLSGVEGQAEGMISNPDALINSFGSKHELHEFISATCNLNTLPEGQMNYNQYGSIICSEVLAISHKNTQYHKLKQIKGVTQRENLEKWAIEHNRAEKQLFYDHDLDHNGDLVKKQAKHTRKFLIQILCTVTQEEFQTQVYKRALKMDIQEKKEKVLKAQIACRRDVLTGLGDWKSKCTNPSRIGGMMVRSMQENYLLKHSVEQRKAYFREKMGRKMRGTNLNLKKHVLKNNQENTHIRLDNYPRENLQAMIERQAEQLKNQDPGNIFNNNFQDIMGVDVDQKMSVLCMISKVLDDMRITNASRFDLKMRSIEELHEWLRFFTQLRNGVLDMWNTEDERELAYEYVKELLDNI